MTSFLLSLLLFLVILAVVFWIAEQIPLPAPFNWIVRVVLAILFLFYLLQYLPLPGHFHL